jgi:hypothetical protein
MTTEQRPPGRIRLVNAASRTEDQRWCDVCGLYADVLVTFGSGQCEICPSCLREALRLVEDAALSPAERAFKHVFEVLDEPSAGKEREP